MPKGAYTQCLVVLTKRAPSLDELEAVLDSYEIERRGAASKQWEFGGPSLLVPFYPEANGYAVVDTVEHVWPDHMGDPTKEPMLFGAWSMGNFGPFTYPGSLQRAGEQSWGWEDAAETAAQHRAMIRVRTSYVLGGDKETPIVPKDYNALAELDFVTSLAYDLMSLPDALCYFNPNGEVLKSGEHMESDLGFAQSADLPPLGLWSNIRLFRFNDEWNLMDTVGNCQFDIMDHEALFPAEVYDCGEVDEFLRNLTLYLIENGDSIKSGDTVDGPNEVRWQAAALESPTSDPPRRVLRWLPMDGSRPPL